MFIHDGILESITCGNTQVSAPDLQRMVTKLRQRDPHTNFTGYEQQFKVGTFIPKVNNIFLVVQMVVNFFCNFALCIAF